MGSRQETRLKRSNANAGPSDSHFWALRLSLPSMDLNEKEEDEADIRRAIGQDGES